MKIIYIILLTSFLFLTGCEEKKEVTPIQKEYPFTDISWTRDAGNDIETIRFNEDGSYTYYCACGNPVNDSDFCETYIYNEDTKEIKLDCFEITEDTITTIKVINSKENELELDFDGEIRKFKKENNIE